MRILSPIVEHALASRQMRRGGIGAVEGEKAKLVFLDVSNSATQSNFYFKADPELDGASAVISGIECIDVNELAVDPQGNALPTTDVYAKCVLYISDDQRQIMVEQACFPLVRSNQDGTYTNFLLKNQLWSDCYVTTPAGANSFSSVANLAFIVYYFDKNSPMPIF